MLFTSLMSSSSSPVSHWSRKGPANAERNVRGWPAESKLRTGAPADVARRREAGARRLAAKGEGEERRCTKYEREREGGAPAEAAARDREGREGVEKQGGRGRETGAPAELPAVRQTRGAPRALKVLRPNSSKVRPNNRWFASPLRKSAERQEEGRESLLVSSLVLRGETPTSEGGRGEGENFFEPMGR